MRTLRSLLLGTLAVLALAAAGCTDTVDPNVNKATLLTDNPWKITKWTTNGQPNASAPTYIAFGATGVYTATLASGATETGSWEFNVDETNVVMHTPAGEDLNWNILTLSSSALHLRSNRTSGSVTVVDDLEAEPS